MRVYDPVIKMTKSNTEKKPTTDHVDAGLMKLCGKQKGSASYQDCKDCSVTPPQNIPTLHQWNQQHLNTSSALSENCR